MRCVCVCGCCMVVSGWCLQYERKKVLDVAVAAVSMVPSVVGDALWALISHPGRRACALMGRRRLVPCLASPTFGYGQVN